jgi:hypothetical protein
MAISLDHVQRLADLLSPLDQVRLIEHLSRQIALALATLDTPAQSDREEAWAKLAQLREELVTLPADRPANEQLPVLTGGTWADDLPSSRKDLYGADERC